MSLFILILAAAASVRSALSFDFGAVHGSSKNGAGHIPSAQNTRQSVFSLSPFSFAVSRFDTQTSTLSALLAQSLATQFVEVAMEQRMEDGNKDVDRNTLETITKKRMVQTLKDLQQKADKSLQTWWAQSHPSSVIFEDLIKREVGAEMLGATIRRETAGEFLEVLSGTSGGVVVFRPVLSATLKEERYFYYPEYLSSDLEKVGSPEVSHPKEESECRRPNNPAYKWHSFVLKEGDIVFGASEEFFRLVPLSFLTFAVNILVSLPGMASEKLSAALERFIDRLSEQITAEKEQPVQGPRRLMRGGINTDMATSLTKNLKDKKRAKGDNSERDPKSSDTEMSKLDESRVSSKSGISRVNPPTQRGFTSRIGDFFMSFVPCCGTQPDFDFEREHFRPRREKLVNIDESFLGTMNEDGDETVDSQDEHEVIIPRNPKADKQLKHYYEAMVPIPKGKGRRLMEGKKDDSFRMDLTTEYSNRKRSKRGDRSALDQSFQSNNQPAVEPAKEESSFWKDFLNFFDFCACAGPRKKKEEKQEEGRYMKPTRRRDSMDESELDSDEGLEGYLAYQEQVKKQYKDYAEVLRKRREEERSKHYSPPDTPKKGNGDRRDRRLSKSPEHEVEEESKVELQAKMDRYFNILFDCPTHSIVNALDTRESTGSHLSRCIHNHFATHINLDSSQLVAFMDNPNINRFSEVFRNLAVKFASADPALRPVNGLYDNPEEDTQKPLDPAAMFVITALTVESEDLSAEELKDAKTKAAMVSKLLDGEFETLAVIEWKRELSEAVNQKRSLPNKI